MTTNCPCGGRFRRTDTVAAYDDKYKRVMVSDTDPAKANWACDKCGATRTQRKRQSAVVEGELVVPETATQTSGHSDILVHVSEVQRATLEWLVTGHINRVYKTGSQETLDMLLALKRELQHAGT